MSSLNWKVEDVMSYFGEWFRNEIEAANTMRIVKDRVKDFSKYSYFGKMNCMRDYLKEQGYEVIFRTGYRRSK